MMPVRRTLQELAMSTSGAGDAASVTAHSLQEVYRWVREIVADLSEAQLGWQPGITAPSIRFHLFHIARWADDLHQLLTGAERQLWHTEGIAAAWGIDPTTLGFAESGAMIPDDVAAAIPFPEKMVLLAYCDRIIAETDAVLAGVTDESIDRLVTNERGKTFPAREAIISQLSHTARHLGMIECLKGVQGLHGTATV